MLFKGVFQFVRRSRIIYAILAKGIMGKICVKLLVILTSDSGGDVI